MSYVCITDVLRRSNNPMTRTETINIRLPQEVVDILDTLIEKGLFANRSEAIREFCREYVQEVRC